MTKDEEDIVLRFIAAMRDAGASFTEEVANVAEQNIRQEFGGARAYVSKRPARGKAVALGTAIRSGANIREAMAKANVAKTWGYALLMRRA